jgi:hypothetical protein
MDNQLTEGSMSELTNSQHDCRDLWASVVAQAIDDIENRPMWSDEFAQAVAFFTRKDRWAESRTMVADFLNIHPDDLEAVGRRCINARLASENMSSDARAECPKAHSAASSAHSVSDPTGRRDSIRSGPKGRGGAERHN